MSQKKVDRTNEFETAVKTAIMDDMVRKEIQQIKFDNLLKRGIICTEDIIEVDAEVVKFEGERN